MFHSSGILQLPIFFVFDRVGPNPDTPLATPTLRAERRVVIGRGIIQIK